MMQRSKQVALRVTLCVIAIALVYFVFIGRPKAKQLTRLETQIERSGSVLQLEQQKRDVLIEQQAVQREIKSLEARRDELTSTASASVIPARHGTPADFVHDISRRIKDHGLRIVEDQLINSKHVGRLPVYLQNTTNKPTQWQVTLAGSYTNVARLLETLARDPRVIPAHVTMEQPNLASPRRVWTLTIWLP